MGLTDEGFKNNLREMIVGPPDPYLIEKATRTVCAYAKDTDDAYFLLDALGIKKEKKS